jgi:hypothetical protein
MATGRRALNSKKVASAPYLIRLGVEKSGHWRMKEASYFGRRWD